MLRCCPLQAYIADAPELLKPAPAAAVEAKAEALGGLSLALAAGGGEAAAAAEGPASPCAPVPAAAPKLANGKLPGELAGPAAGAAAGAAGLRPGAGEEEDELELGPPEAWASTASSTPRGASEAGVSLSGGSEDWGVREALVVDGLAEGDVPAGHSDSEASGAGRAGRGGGVQAGGLNGYVRLVLWQD